MSIGFILRELTMHAYIECVLEGVHTLGRWQSSPGIGKPPPKGGTLSVG